MANDIIIFGGSFGQAEILKPGPDPDLGEWNYYYKPWTETPSGLEVPISNMIKYPGYVGGVQSGSPGKPRQALDAQNRNLAPGLPVIIIGYSAGTESALMYARWRVNQGQLVRAVALLGPTFVSFNEDFVDQSGSDTSLALHFGSTNRLESGELDESDIHFTDWADYVSYLLINHVDVLVWGDNGSSLGSGEYPLPEDPNGTHNYGNFEHMLRGGIQHFAEGETGIATNNSPAIRDEIYAWIYSH
jgi:hypothetical protein